MSTFSLGNWLHHRLLARQWTQSELSKRTGIDVFQIIGFITERVSPTTEEMDKIVAALTDTKAP